MKLIKLVINDFRQFHGKNVIVFSQDKDRSITLIHGENGTGKTTLLNSVLWCFYGRLTNEIVNKNEIINHDSLRNGINFASVEIYFEHDDKRYCAQRKMSAKDNRTTVTVMEVESDGNFGRSISPSGPFIDSVIPSQMADYFFFHGEGISSLVNEDNSQNYRKAIRNILGFTAAEFAIEDLEAIQKKWLNKCTQLEKKDGQYGIKLKEQQDLKATLDAIKLKIAEFENKIKKHKASKERLENERLNIKVEDVSSLAKKGKELDKLISMKLMEQSKCDDDERLLVKRFALNIFGYELSRQSLADIEEQDVLGMLPSPFDEGLITELTKAQRCLCGRELLPDTDPYNTVLALRNVATTKEIKSRRIKAIKSLGAFEQQPDEFVDSWNDIKSRKIIVSSQIQKAKNERDEINNKLIEIGDGGHNKLKEINNKMSECESVIDNSISSLANAQRNLTDNSRKILECERIIASLTPNDELTRKLQAQVLYVSQLIAICQKKLEDTESSSKSIITKYINDILQQFSRKDFKVFMNEDFEYKMVRNDGAIVASSKGESLLLNLAFISALIKFCAIRKGGDNRFYIKGTVAPFFIDAPFGELDDTYRAATANFLPKSCEQLILLLSSSHWSGTVDKEINSKVDREYILVSHKKQAQGDKPDDVIKIKNKSYHQSVYSSDFDGSKIVEV